MIRFASGSNRPADIRGFAAIGRAIGVAFPEVSPESERELAALAGRGIPVFVDSGAFSEIEFGPAGPVVVAPITTAGWDARMAMYRRLGAALGSSCYVVAPDRIGDQAHTLALLTERAVELAEIAATGAIVLVPIQKGSMTQAAFHRAVAVVLGDMAWTPALPSKKNATTVAELEAYVAEIKPASIHLLGLGEKNKNAVKSLALIEQHSPGCVVSLDANLIAASVGRTNGRGGGPRILTAARDRAAIMLDSGEARGYTTQELGIILAFGTKEHEDDAYLSGWADLRV